MNLTDEQLTAVNEIGKHLQIIACAGSGKTEVIVRRIVNILKKKAEIRPEQIVAFTFTEKAAESMKSRVQRALSESGKEICDDMYIGTIHGFCYYVLKKYDELFEDFKILDAVKSHLFVERYYDKCGMSELGLQPYPKNVQLFLECIGKMVDDYDNSDQWEMVHRSVFEKYRTFLYEHKYLDFALLIYETVQQIKNNYALKNYLASIKYLIVDEYQDIDDMQERLIQLFAAYGTNICTVGDDDQTIYQFRGSNADNMIHFSNRYQDVVQVRLEKNFRCTDKIVNVAASVIEVNKNRLKKQMVSKALEAEASCVEARRFESSDDEYVKIAEQISILHEKGIPYSEVAVLVRKGKYINPICTELERHGIPCDSDSAEYFFRGLYFSRFADTIQILADMDKAKLYECWDGMVERERFNKGFRYLQRARRGGNGSPVLLSNLFKGFLNEIGFMQCDKEARQEREDAANGFITILSDYEEIYQDQQYSARITGLMRFLTTRVMDEYKYHNFRTKEDGTDAVQVMTVHKSKGLEFHTVFLPELEESVFPAFNIGGRRYWHVLGSVFEKNKNKYASDIEDERKLFYVALTRARQNLFLYYELSKRNLSRFVREAAKSNCLDIEQYDLDYEVPKRSSSVSTYSPKYQLEGHQMKNEEYQQKKAYREQMRMIRHEVLDYYGSAIHFFPTARGDYERAKGLDDEGLLTEARKLGII